MASEEVQKIIQANEIGNSLHLFVKRDDNQERSFYYLGKLDYKEDSAKNEKIGEKGSEVSVVTMDLQLKTPMTSSLFHYLVRDD